MPSAQTPGRRGEHGEKTTQVEALALSPEVRQGEEVDLGIGRAALL